MNTEKKDVATLIELLKMEAERWPQLRPTKFRKAIYSTETFPCLKCGQKPADALASESANSRTGVIKLWKKRLGRAN